MAPEEEAKWPGGQSTQVLSPDVLWLYSVPAGQTLQTVAPLLNTVGVKPNTQVQLAMEGEPALEAVLSGQAAQLMPSPTPYWLTAQGTQLAELVVGATSPARQGAQTGAGN